MNHIGKLSIKALEQGHTALSDEELIQLKDYYIKLMRDPEQPKIVEPLSKREIKKIDTVLLRVG